MQITIISRRSRRVWPPDGDGGSANRAIGLGPEPHVDTRSVEQMLTHTELPDLLAFAENRQANGTLAADLLPMGVLPVPEVGEHRSRISSVMRRRFGEDGGWSSRSFVRMAAMARGTPDGEDEGVD